MVDSTASVITAACEINGLFGAAPIATVSRFQWLINVAMKGSEKGSCEISTSNLHSFLMSL